MIERRSYLKSFDRSKKTLTKKLTAYLKDPSEDNVHDLRVAIRRMLALCQLMPKRLRGTKAKRYSSRYDKLMKLNARTRDIDTILGKISNRDQDDAYDKILDDLRKARKSSLHRPLELALSIKNDPTLKIRAKELSSRRLVKRFKKITEKLRARIKNRLSIVLESPEEKNELHLLREDSRRLRYVLELAMSRSNTRPLDALRVWQDTLGAIHDDDVFIQHFKDQKESPVIRSLLQEETVERDRLYQNFRTMAKEFPKIPS